MSLIAATPLLAQPTFRAGVDVVTINAVVTDRSGRFVSGLRQEDFAVEEDGKKREIVYFEGEDTPVSLAILLDASGSMGDGRGAGLNLGRELIARLVMQLDAKTEWMFARFTSAVVVAQEWTTDRDAITQPLRETRATGNTSLNDAIALSIPLVQEGHFQKKTLLVISDERETTSLVRRDEALRAISNHDVRLYTVNVKADARSAMARVEDELRHQYLLGYSTDVANDGRSHSIRVETKRRGLSVLSRRAHW